MGVTILNNGNNNIAGEMSLNGVTRVNNISNSTHPIYYLLIVFL
jgi:hypothetical protein